MSGYYIMAKIKHSFNRRGEVPPSTENTKINKQVENKIKYMENKYEIFLFVYIIKYQF